MVLYAERDAMAEDNTEVCGFLSVKYLSNKRKTQKIKKRTLASWKVWRRHWCSIQNLGSGLGLIVQLDYSIGNSTNVLPNEKENSIVIPLDTIVCRTQSRSKQFAFGFFLGKERKPLLYLAGNSEVESQRWMNDIRHLMKPRKCQLVPGSHSVSLIDNVHSKASGLTGLYGDLITNSMGVFIKDASTGKIIENFEWKQFDQFHLITAGHPEDVKCTCVIHTTKEFRGGVGELYMFCLEAGKLLQALVTLGRGLKNRCADWKSLSLSEGDLRTVMPEEASKSYPTLGSTFGAGFIGDSISSFPSMHFESRGLNKNVETHFKYENTGFQMHDRAIENVYQPEPASIPNITDILEDLPDCSRNRRISDISMASGIYEEIADKTDNNKVITSNYNHEEFLKNSLLEKPPPLPPRQRCGSKSINNIRSQDVQSPDDEIRSMILKPGAAASTAVDVILREKAMESCNYVPMSPRLKDITLEQLQMQTSPQENDYMIMR